ncbi:MAG: terminase family protein [Kiritimatiellae bacterium]|nr:terminase family protein [Kiritimatiellia bacterium]
MAVTFNYVPHPAQRAIHEARSFRFRTVCTGHRFGKTLCLAAELLDRGGCERAGDYGWVAPTYNVAERGIDAFREIADGFIRVVGRMPTRIEFEGAKGLVRIWFLSADNPNAIRGYGFEGLVIDEAAMIPKDVWHYVLRPTISQTLGWAVFVSTPKGRNWFCDLFEIGQDAAEKDYTSFWFPSKASPYFPESEWEDAKRTLPSNVFHQEYQAQFLEGSTGVFRGIDSCLFDPLSVEGCQLPVGSEMVIGCDLAKHRDFTVLIAMDAATGRCWDMERFNQLDWPIQKERILAFVRKWRGRLILDCTGIGDPIFDDLKTLYPNVEGFKLTAGSKTQLVQRLIVAVEQQRVMWPREWEVLTNEMKRFEYVISPSGHISYNAPSGYHDDCVMALALANHGRWEREGAGRMLRIAPSGRGYGIRDNRSLGSLELGGRRGRGVGRGGVILLG